MNKHINKFLGIGLALSILPQMAFASWWNPFSWFRASEQPKRADTEVLEKRIKELESKINTVSTTTLATSSPVVKKEVKKILPKIDNTANEAKAKAQANAILKAKLDEESIIAKQKLEAQAKLQQEEIQRNAQIEQEKKRALSEEITKAENELAQIRTAKQKLDEKQAKLDAINLKIANLNAKYADDIKKLDAVTQTLGQREAGYNAIRSIYITDYNILMAEFQQVQYSN